MSDEREDKSEIGDSLSDFNDQASEDDNVQLNESDFETIEVKGLINTCDCATDDILSLAYSPVPSEGTLCAAGSVDGNVYLIDSETGACIRTFTHHNDTVTQVLFNYTGKYIFSSSMDGTVLCWPISGGKPIAEASGPGGSIEWMRAHRKGNAVLVGSEDGSAWIFNFDSAIQVYEKQQRALLSTQSEVEQKKAQQEANTQISKTSVIVNSAEEGPVVVNTNKIGQKQETSNTDSNSPTKQKVSPLPAAELVSMLVGHQDAVSCGCFNTNQRYAITGAYDGSLRVWNPLTGECLSKIEGLGPICCMEAFAPKLGNIIIGTQTGQVAIYTLQEAVVRDKKTIKLRKVLDLPSHDDEEKKGGEAQDDEVNCSVEFAVVINARYAVTGGTDGSIIVSDLSANGALRWRIKLPDDCGCTQIAYDTSSPVVYVGTTTGVVVVFDIIGGKLMYTMDCQVKAPVYALATSKFQQRLPVCAVAASPVAMLFSTVPEDYKEEEENKSE